MGRSHTPSYVITRRIITHQKNDGAFLDRKFGLGNRAYNNGVRHCIGQVRELYADEWYGTAYRGWKAARAAGDDDAAKEWSGEIFLCMEAYGLTEYGIHGYMNDGRNRSFPKGLPSDVVQKLGSALYRSVVKAVFSRTLIHFRKHGATDTLEEKKADTGIIYREHSDTVTVFGREFRLKGVRKKDAYLQEAMSGLKVKYCRIVRVPRGKHFRYFLQIVAKGVPPAKTSAGTGRCGIDEGVSTVSFTNDRQTRLLVLAEGVEKHDREIRRAAARYTRRVAAANPGCLAPDGTWKKGARIRNHTKGMAEAMMHLKTAYRKKSDFVRNCHGRMVNGILSGCSTVIKEPMNYRALQKRSSSAAERSDKVSVITKKDGTKREVRKFRRKKRFGPSINRRSPGLFNSMLEAKAMRLGIPVIDVDIKAYRASQLNHDTGEYEKHGLSERTKEVGGHRVQRDTYSSWLMYCYEDDSGPDLDFCKADYVNYLKKQDDAIIETMIKGDTTGNFGLKDFFNAV